MISRYNKKKMTDQKNRICVIYIGAAAHSNISGQLSNIKKESTLGIQFISVDPYYSNLMGNNPGNNINIYQENIEQCCGIPVNFITNSPNHIDHSSMNICASTSEDFFANFRHDTAIFYLILTFIGYDLEHTTFQIAKNLRIQTPYFYNLRNALFLGMSCLAKPPNILQILHNYDLHPQNIPFVSNIEQSKHNAYYALLQSIDMLCTHYRKKEVRDWHANSLKNLRELGILSYEDACQYYDKMENKNAPDARKSIHDYLESINMLKIFKNERKNDFH
jgi:hypothetical protein